MNKKRSINLILFLIIIVLFVNNDIKGEETKKVPTITIAEKVLNKGIDTIDLGLYPGTLLMHAMSELALVHPKEKVLNRTISLFEKYKTKEIEGRGSFISYQAGGSGAAYLMYKDVTDALDKQVVNAADSMMNKQKRSSEGLMVPHWVEEGHDQVFIDMAFAVTPYVLYTGLAINNNDYIDLAVYETLKLFEILRDKETGLVHQARGFQKAGKITEDNWSRGNGWAAFALSILVKDLPAEHPRKNEVEELAKSFFHAIIRHQNKEGLWHQEMTDTSSYVETSGSGLILYGLGIMLERGLMPDKYKINFMKGLERYSAYIKPDGSVSHTCSGCLAPGEGTKQDYINHPWVYNDPHAFGPVVLAFTQAFKMGIEYVSFF